MSTVDFVWATPYCRVVARTQLKVVVWSRKAFLAVSRPDIGAKRSFGQYGLVSDVLCMFASGP